VLGVQEPQRAAAALLDLGAREELGLLVHKHILAAREPDRLRGADVAHHERGQVGHGRLVVERGTAHDGGEDRGAIARIRLGRVLDPEAARQLAPGDLGDDELLGVAAEECR